MASSRAITATVAASSVKDEPKKTHPSGSTLHAWAGGYAYIYWSIPFPRGATIISARLTLHIADAWNTNRTTFLQRVSQGWSASKVTWNNRPDLGTMLYQNSPGAKKNAAFAFDIKGLMQGVANGTPWYGVAFRSNHDSLHRIWSDSAPNTAMRPRIDIVWSVPPDQPSGLSPHSGMVVNTPKPRLIWGYTDRDGNTTMTALNVQVANNSALTSGLWGSGVVASASPILDLATTSYPGIAEGATVYWRAQNRDDAGLWSPWSAVASFKRVGHGTTTITNPSDLEVIRNPAPVIDWTFTPPAGFTQAQWRVVVTDSTSQQVIHDTGPVVGIETSYQLPYGLLAVDGASYSIEVRILDSVPDRATVGGDSAWQSDIANVTYSATGTGAVANITDLNVVGNEGNPSWQLTWSSAQAGILYFLIFRYSQVTDEEILVDTISRAAAQIEGQPNNFTYVDNFVPGRSSYTWRVQTVTDNDSGLSNLKTAVVKNRYPWLMPYIDDGVDRRVAMVNASIDPALSEITDVVEPLDGDPMLISQKYGGFAGSGEARLVNDLVVNTDGSLYTAQQFKQNFLWMRENPLVFLLWSDETILCYIYNCSYKPISMPTGKTEYTISFNFVQVSEP
jgi:hypothetical protein